MFGRRKKPAATKRRPAVTPDPQAIMRDAKGEYPTRRKDGQNLPQHVQDKVDALRIQNASVRQQLDVLRRTRGQRSVGSVKIPLELQVGETLRADPSVRRLADRQGFVRPAED